MFVEEKLLKISNEIIYNWNKGDFVEIYHYLHPELSFKCPFVKLVYPNYEDDFISGNEKVVKYWIDVNEVLDNKKFKIFHSEIEGKNVILKCTIQDKPEIMTLNILFDNYGKVINMIAEYS